MYPKDRSASIIGLAVAEIGDAGRRSVELLESRLGPPCCDTTDDCGAADAAVVNRNDSANHSYHTLFASVRRQIERCSSELLGKYSGSYRGCERSKIYELKGENVHLQRKETREPAEHVFGYTMHALRMNAQPNISVQHRFKVSAKSMQSASMGYMEFKSR